MMMMMMFDVQGAPSAGNGSCPDGVQWIWTMMGDCAVTTREQASAYAGILSIFTWILVGIPQIFKNFRNTDGMAGLSFLLLAQWSAGDTTNLTGAILTHQLKPQIYLAVYFVVCDAVLLLQYLYYYTRVVRRKKKEGSSKADVAAASRAVLCFMGLMSFTHCLTSCVGTGNSPVLDAGSGMTIGARVQLVQTGRVSRFLLSNDDDGRGGSGSDSGGIDSGGGGDRGNSDNRQLSSLVFKSEVGFPYGRGGDFGVDWTSPQHKHSPTFWRNTEDLVGYVLGCVSSVFAIGSRIPQIVKNHNKKSTDGLAFLMFFLAIVGNLLYGAQILIQDLDTEFLLEHTPWIVGSLPVIFLDCIILIQDLNTEFLLEHTPWIVGSLPVIFLDCIVLWQFHRYKHKNRKQKDEESQTLLAHNVCAIN